MKLRRKRWRLPVQRLPTPGVKRKESMIRGVWRCRIWQQGQARQAEGLEEAVAQLERFTMPEFAITDAIDLGAMVELERDGEWTSYLLLPVGGGIEIEEEGIEVTTLTTDSPLFAQLKGKRIGEEVGNGATVSEVS